VELRRFALDHRQPHRELMAPMRYMLVAHLALHNMLARFICRMVTCR